jgi:hypothetical protein
MTTHRSVGIRRNDRCVRLQLDSSASTPPTHWHFPRHHLHPTHTPHEAMAWLVTTGVVRCGTSSDPVRTWMMFGHNHEAPTTTVLHFLRKVKSWWDEATVQRLGICACPFQQQLCACSYYSGTSNLLLSGVLHFLCHGRQRNYSVEIRSVARVFLADLVLVWEAIVSKLVIKVDNNIIIGSSK